MVGNIHKENPEERLAASSISSLLGGLVKAFRLNQGGSLNSIEDKP